jgi:N-acetyl sugar amidotransferase
MEFCSKCGFPNTRPGLIFRDGVCGACINFDKRKTIDWDERKRKLEAIVTPYRGKMKYDCLIPVSGGKDSYFLVRTMCNLGMNPLLVTVTDSFTHTKAGSHNLRNLITRYNLNHWQYTISHDLFKRATRSAFEETGEALKFVEYAIYTIPVRLAQSLGIPLVVFGENSAYEYGSTEEDNWVANSQIRSMITKVNDERKWWESRGITSKEVDSILPMWPLGEENPLVIYMSHFYQWSSVNNFNLAKEMGFRDLTGEWDRKGTIENFEQIDSVAYMTHLWLKYPKFGFQRVTDIATRRVREGRLTFKEAQDLIAKHDSILDPLALKDFIETMGYTEHEFYDIVKKHTRSGK